MEAPKDKSELKTILGMITYLSRYAPKTSSGHCQTYLRKMSFFTWMLLKKKTFLMVKDILTECPGQFHHILTQKRHQFFSVTAHSMAWVMTEKELLSIVFLPNTYPELSELRATPLRIGYSPTEIMMGRKIRTFLPMSTNNSIPKTIDYKKMRSLLEKQKGL